MQEIDKTEILRFPYEAPDFFEIPITRFTARGEENGEGDPTGGLPEEKKEDWDDPFNI